MVGFRSAIPLALVPGAGTAQPQDLGQTSAQEVSLSTPAATEPFSRTVGTTVFRGRLLPYTVVDGMAVHVGDMVLGPIEELEPRAYLDLPSGRNVSFGLSMPRFFDDGTKLQFGAPNLISH